MRRGEIGAAEAEAILGIKRCLLHTLIRTKWLRARLIDKRGERRQWAMKRTDVLALKAQGVRKITKPRPKRQRALWQHYFGPIPTGFSPAFRDGDRKNIVPSNLCLIPLKYRWRLEARGERRMNRKAAKQVWTKEMIATLRREYPNQITADVANELGVTTFAARRKAHLLKLRKNMDVVREQLHNANSCPIGTERVHEHSDTVFLKVKDKGTFRETWRPKHHVIWERANGRRVPTRNVIFKDSNRRNFDPANLVALGRHETSAFVNIRFHQCYPKELREMIRLTTRARQEANRQLFGELGRKTERTSRSRSEGSARRTVVRQRRWTAEMDEVLLRDYPRKPQADVAASLRVSAQALRCRARKLGAGQRLPEIIMAEARARDIAKPTPIGR